MLEGLSVRLKLLVALCVVGILQQVANVGQLILEVLVFFLLFFGPGARIGHSDNGLQHVVVVKVVRIESTHHLNGISHLLLPKHVFCLSQQGSLVSSDGLASGLLVTRILLFLLFLGRLLLWVDQKADLSHDVNERLLGHLKESVAKLC